jgi:serine/threonine-protein kinase RsbW
MIPNASTFQTQVIGSDSCACLTRGSKPRTLEGHLAICGDWHQCLVVQELMASCARTYEFEEFAVRKAVLAALANAFKHGNCEAPEKCIRVDYAMDETEFRVAVTDEGSGFDHGAVTVRNNHKSTGRGLGLMRHYMTAVRFNELGNRVELSKHKGNA